MKLPQIFRLSIILLPLLLVSSGAQAAPRPSIQPPVLKWQHGGCYASWCETGWYASPAVADLDGDGMQEVIGAAYTVFILNGADGSLAKISSRREPLPARSISMTAWETSSSGRLWSSSTALAAICLSSVASEELTK